MAEEAAGEGGEGEVFAEDEEDLFRHMSQVD